MKTFSFKIDALTGEEFLEVYIRGRQLLNDPLLNKGSGFTREERLAFGLEGFLRSGYSSMEVQVERTLEAYRRKPDAMERYIFLSGLLDLHLHRGIARAEVPLEAEREPFLPGEARSLVQERVVQELAPPDVDLEELFARERVDFERERLHAYTTLRGSSAPSA